MSALRDPGSVMTVIVIVTTGMIFWRAIIKLAVAAFLGLAIFGLLALLQGLH
jgi:hypothetical protein